MANQTQSKDISGYHLVIRDDGVKGFYNPVTQHFLIPVDVEPEAIGAKSGNDE